MKQEKRLGIAAIVAASQEQKKRTVGNGRGQAVQLTDAQQARLDSLLIKSKRSADAKGHIPASDLRPKKSG